MPAPHFVQGKLQNAPPKFAAIILFSPTHYAPVRLLGLDSENTIIGQDTGI